MSGQLRIGDRVEWSPSWGMLPFQLDPVEVVGIEADGHATEALPWATIEAETSEVFVDLANGHWAYGYQLRPVVAETGGAA